MIDLPNHTRYKNSENSKDEFQQKSQDIGDNILNPFTQLQISDLNNEKPLIKISNIQSLNDEDNSENYYDSVNNINLFVGNIIETDWKKLVGTNILFDNSGEIIAKVTEHLVYNDNVKFISKKDNSNTFKEDNSSNINFDFEEETQRSKQKKNDDRSNFLKKVTNYAMKKKSKL